MKYTSFIILIFSFCAMSSYARQKPKRIFKGLLSAKTMTGDYKEYRLTVSGVECKVCARSVVQALDRLVCIKDPQFYYVDNDWQQSYVVMHIQPLAHNFERMTAILQEIQYPLAALYGDFEGFVEQSAQQWWFVIPLLNCRFNIAAVPDSLLKKLKYAKKDLIVIRGTALLQSKEFVPNAMRTV